MLPSCALTPLDGGEPVSEIADGIEGYHQSACRFAAQRHLLPGLPLPGIFPL
jgi:hypothetical protein